MKKKEQLQKALETLKENKTVSFQYTNKTLVLFDSKNEAMAEKLNNSKVQHRAVIISSDRMANQCVKDIPEVAWDMMDYATTPLTLILDGGQFISKPLLHADASIALQKVTEGDLFELVTKNNKPLACYFFQNPTDFDSDFQVQMNEKLADQKIIRIRLNGEVEIIAN